MTAPSGAGLPGVQLTLSGGNSASTVSDAGGNYSFPALATGNYVVIPSAAGASFAPQTLSVTVNGQATSGVSFARTAQSYESTQFIAEYMAVLHGQTLSTFAANEKALFRQTAASGQTGAYYTASANDYTALIQGFAKASLAFVTLKAQTMAVDRDAVLKEFAAYAAQDSAFVGTYYASVPFGLAGMGLANFVASTKLRIGDIYVLATLALP